MRSLSGCVVAVVFAAVSIASAQWPSHPTPGTPRLADGEPDLNAPTPRTADGKPDFSGIWENRFGPIGGRGRGAAHHHFDKK